MSTDRPFRSTAVSAQLSDRMLDVLLTWVRTALVQLQTAEPATGAVMESVRLLFESARRYPASPLHMELDIGPGPAGVAIQIRAVPLARQAEHVNVSTVWQGVSLPWRQVRVVVRQREATVVIEEIPAASSRPKW